MRPAALYFSLPFTSMLILILFGTRTKIIEQHSCGIFFSRQFYTRLR